MEPFDVFHPDPNPRSASSLIAPTQVEPGAVAPHAGEVIVAPTGVLETQNVHVKPEAGLHVFHAQDRLTAFKTHPCRIAVSHVVALLCRSIVPTK